MTLYPEIARALINHCRQYRQQEKDLVSLRASLSHAAEQITALEDRALRHRLLKTEAELDSAQFKFDSDTLFPETLKILDALEATLLASLQSE